MNTEDTTGSPARRRERMSRLAMIPSTGRSVLDPVPRLILAVDVEGSTLRTNLMKGELRRIMYALLDRALRATGIDRKHLEQPVDRGDGVLLLFRPDDEVPKTLLLGQLVSRLAAVLVEHNATVAEPALQLRLRVVFHAGQVHDDGWGFYGEDLDVAFRLLDSPAVKKALKNEPTDPLVLVISDEIHSGIVRHGYVDVGPYVGSVRVSVANRRRRGWVHFPLPLPAARTRTSLRVIAPPPAEPEELWEEPWEPALSAVYQALEQHLDETYEPYDVEAGLAKLKKWMSARKMSERSPIGRAAGPVRHLHGSREDVAANSE